MIFSLYNYSFHVSKTAHIFLTPAYLPRYPHRHLLRGLRCPKYGRGHPPALTSSACVVVVGTVVGDVVFGVVCVRSRRWRLHLRSCLRRCRLRSLCCRCLRSCCRRCRLRGCLRRCLRRCRQRRRLRA